MSNVESPRWLLIFVLIFWRRNGWKMETLWSNLGWIVLDLPFIFLTKWRQPILTLTKHSFNFLVYYFLPMKGNPVQLIITVCLQFSKVFPTYWCMLSLGFISFFPPISWVHHDVSWVFLVVRSFIVFLDFINLPHQSLHCTIHFHQFSPSYLSLDFICFPQVLVHFTIGVHHLAHPFLDFIMRFQSVFPTYLFIFSLGFVSFPHILAHLITDFYWVSPFLPFIRGFHHVPVLLQCVYYALSLSNLSIISSI